MCIIKHIHHFPISSVAIYLHCHLEQSSFKIVLCEIMVTWNKQLALTKSITHVTFLNVNNQFKGLDLLRE